MIVVFDAQCLLCNRWVKFLLRHDQRRVLRFASIQGAHGQALLARAGLKVEGLQTLLLVDGDHIWQHTAALLRMFHALGGAWRLAWLGWLVPATLRDALYRFLARHRYAWFGRSDTCLLPPADYAQRFLD